MHLAYAGKHFSDYGNEVCGFADCPGFVQQHEAGGSQKNIAHFQKLLQGFEGLVQDNTSAAWWLAKQAPRVRFELFWLFLLLSLLLFFLLTSHMCFLLPPFLFSHSIILSSQPLFLSVVCLSFVSSLPLPFVPIATLCMSVKLSSKAC